MQSRLMAILVSIVLAIMAVLALVIYARSADQRAISNAEPVTVYVARSQIAANTSAEKAYQDRLIEKAEIPRRMLAEDAIVSLDQIRGKVAAVTIVKGEQLLGARWVAPGAASGQQLLPIPPDHQAISVALDATRQVSGFITPGDLVSVVASFRITGAANGTKQVTQFLLQNVQVLAVGRQALTNPAAQGGSGQGGADQGRAGQGGTGLGGAGQAQSQNQTTVTLAVDKNDVERVVFAAEFGTIYLSLVPNGQKEVPTKGREIINEF